MTNMRYVIFEDNLVPLSEPVVHRKCVCSAGEKEKQQKSHLEGKRSKQKTPKEKSTIKNSRTLFLPICQVLYDVTWSAENPEQAQLLPICCEQPLLSTWVLQVTYHPSTFSKKNILIFSSIL